MIKYKGNYCNIMVEHIKDGYLMAYVENHISIGTFGKDLKEVVTETHRLFIKLTTKEPEDWKYTNDRKHLN